MALINWRTSRANLVTALGRTGDPDLTAETVALGASYLAALDSAGATYDLYFPPVTAAQTAAYQAAVAADTAALTAWNEAKRGLWIVAEKALRQAATVADYANVVYPPVDPLKVATVNFDTGPPLVPTGLAPPLPSEVPLKWPKQSFTPLTWDVNNPTDVDDDDQLSALTTWRNHLALCPLFATDPFCTTVATPAYKAVFAHYANPPRPTAVEPSNRGVPATAAQSQAAIAALESAVADADGLTAYINAAP